VKITPAGRRQALKERGSREKIVLTAEKLCGLAETVEAKKVRAKERKKCVKKSHRPSPDRSSLLFAKGRNGN